MTNKSVQGAKFILARWVLRREHLVAQTQVFGLRMRVRAEDSIGRKLYKYGMWEKTAVEFLRDRLELHPGDVVLDIGANLGWYSLILDRVSPRDVDIYAFEPDPVNFGLLQDNIALNDARRVHAVRKALSDTEEVKTLYLYAGKNRGRHSLLPLHAGERIQVPTTTLDRFWETESLGDRIPRFIKIDVEGYEYFALKGGERVLSRCRLLLMEYSPHYMHKSGIEPRRLLDLLLAAGLRPSRLGRDGLSAVDPHELGESQQRENLVWERS